MGDRAVHVIRSSEAPCEGLRTQNRTLMGRWYVLFVKGFAGMDFKKKRDGVFFKTICGKNVQFGWVVLDPGR